VAAMLSQAAKGGNTAAAAAFTMWPRCFRKRQRAEPPKMQPERPSQCCRDAFASGQGRQHCSRSGHHNVAAMLSQTAKGGTAKNATGAAFTVLPRCFRKRPRAATLQPQRPSQCGRDAFASGQGRQHPHCASEALRHCGAHGLPKSLRCRTALLGRGSGGPKDQRPHE